MIILFACILVLGFSFMLRVYKLLLHDKSQDKTTTSVPSASTAVGYFLSKEHTTHEFVKKRKVGYLFSGSCILLILLFNISANVSIWPNIKGLTKDDKQNSIAFRTSRGGNCINEYEALKAVLAAAPANQYIADDIKGILGKPDMILNNGTVYKYNLFPSSDGCMGVIEFKDGIVAKCSIENCK